MLKSMTGFSKAEASNEKISVSLEIKSLNGKSLDINCRMPRSISDKELDMRNIIRQKISRGTVSLNVYIERENQDNSFGFDHEEAKNVLSSIQALKKSLKIKDAVKLEDILHYSNHFQKKDSNDEESQVWKLVNQCLRKALQDHDKMRKKEGSNISKDIINRLKNFHNHIKDIEKYGFERIPQAQEKYKEKIAKLFDNDEIDEQRLRTEIVIMADKLDISEECTRLHSHMKLFNETIKSNQAQGRKLNFLIQEVHREINTIGSKSQNTKISHMVVNLKEELERIREQVQNIE